MYPSLNLRSFVNSPNHLYTDCFIANEGNQISFTSGRIHVSNPQKLRIYDNPVEKSVISLMTQQGIYSDNDIYPVSDVLLKIIPSILGIPIKMFIFWSIGIHRILIIQKCLSILGARLVGLPIDRYKKETISKILN